MYTMLWNWNKTWLEIEECTLQFCSFVHIFASISGVQQSSAKVEDAINRGIKEKTGIIWPSWRRHSSVTTVSLDNSHKKTRMPCLLLFSFVKNPLKLPPPRVQKILFHLIWGKLKKGCKEVMVSFRFACAIENCYMNPICFAHEKSLHQTWSYAAWGTHKKLAL